MTNSVPKIIAASLSFSKNEILRKELLASFPNAVFNESGKTLQGEKLSQFLADADGAIIGLEELDSAILNRCSRLKIIAKYGVGLDNIDLSACKKRKINVGWTPGINRLSVAEMTVGFMIGLMRNLYQTSVELKNQNWYKNGGRLLSQKTIGIIGVGNVGKEVVRLLEPFNCKILVNDIIDQTDYYRQNNLQEVSKEVLLQESDIVSIHTPLTEQTKYLINRGTLKLMKPTSYLINTARGAIVNQEDLYQALKDGIITGTALDVYEQEPPQNEKLLSLPNVFCTPHIGGNAQEGMLAMGRSAIQHLRSYFNPLPIRAMQYSKITFIINEVENQFPVDEWVINDIRIWPFVRIKLFSKIGDAQMGSAESSKKSIFSKVSNKIKKIFVKPNKLQSGETLPWPAKTDILFYSLSHFRTRLEDLWYDKHCDPLIDYFQKKGLNSLLLETAYEVPHQSDRYHSKFCLNFYPSQVIAQTGQSLAGEESYKLQDYENFLSYVKQQVPNLDLGVFQKSRLLNFAKQIQVLKAYFKEQLTRSGVKFCFMACYYHLPAMALNMACRELGIPTVDLEHGGQGEFHPAYGRWQRLPHEGYKLLPSIFWTWGQSEADAINNWAQHSDGRHQAIVGGWPWMNMWLEGKNEVVKEYDEKLRGIELAKNQGAVYILFSLPHFEWPLPEWLLEAIVNSPSEWRWWFRLHPRQISKKEQYKNVLARQIKPDKCEVDQASDLPLPVVLKFADVHATLNSGTILDAEQFGIPSVAIDQDALKLFPDQAQTNMLIIGPTTQELLHAIKVQLARKSKLKLRQELIPWQTVLSNLIPI